MDVTWHAARKFSEPALPALHPEALAALPEDLRSELTNAVVTLDGRQIAAVIERTFGVNADLGSVLAHYAGRFSLTTVWDALKDSKSVISNPASEI